MTVDELAQEIRRVDGSNSLGAGALAEALMSFVSPRPAAARDDFVERLRQAHDRFSLFDGVHNEDLVIVIEAADRLSLRQEPRVKAIGWRDMSYQGREEWIGHCAFRESYHITFEPVPEDVLAQYDDKTQMPFILRPFVDGRSNYATSADAKSAAQSDFEKRIRSSLESTPETARHLTLDEQATMDQAWQNSSTVIASIPVPELGIPISAEVGEAKPVAWQDKAANLASHLRRIEADLGPPSDPNEYRSDTVFRDSKLVADACRFMREAADALTASSAPVDLHRVLTAAKMLYANAVGCATNHYAGDFEQMGLPGWLLDCDRDIRALEAYLSCKEPTND